MSDFKPPKPNKVIIALSELLLPFYLNFVERLSFKFSQNPDHPVEKLKGKKAVIVINHSDRQDPLLVVALAKYMQEEFYCIAAREVFDWNYGILGWLFQRFGCFSVDRGTTDFKSIHTVQKILTGSHNKFIVFPEGEVTGDDHLVHEIPPALMHIFLKTQSEITQKQPGESIWILPIGVSYKLETELKKSVSKTLKKVERRLKVKCNREADIATRTHAAVARLLRELSKRYKFALSELEPLHEQARSLSQHICEGIRVALEHRHSREFTMEQLLHSLRSEVLKVINNNTTHKKENREWLLDLDRVERLLIVRRVLSQTPSPIQICRTVDFLESELFGQMTAKGRQTASVYFGSPIEVLPFLQVHCGNKNKAAEQLRDNVHDALQLALDNSHSVAGNLVQPKLDKRSLASNLTV